MIDAKTFPSLYFPSPDVEAQQAPKLQSELQKLWLAHHDDYAPEDRKVAPALAGGNALTTKLIGKFQCLAGNAMQNEMNFLNGALPPHP